MGGGGYVAGPAGLAALSRAPAPGADRGRPPPGARQPPAGAPARAASAWPSRSRAGMEAATWSPGAPSPRRSSPPIATAARRALPDRAGRPLPARLRRQPGRPLDQPLRARRLRRGRRRGLERATTTSIQIAGHRDYPLARRAAGCRRRGRAIHAARVRADPRRPACRLRPRARSGGRLGVRARGGGQAGDPGPLPARDGAPPGRQRGLDGGGGRARS